mgnify:CR=1 FL=1
MLLRYDKAILLICYLLKLVANRLLTMNCLKLEIGTVLYICCRSCIIRYILSYVIKNMPVEMYIQIPFYALKFDTLYPMLLRYGSNLLLKLV